MLTSILIILVYKPKWQVLVIKSVGGSHIIPQWEDGVIDTTMALWVPQKGRASISLHPPPLLKFYYYYYSI
jgi:hypothetical protein